MPTLKEQGVDVALTNWRGVMAPPGITDEDKQALADMVGQMVESRAWQTTLEGAAAGSTSISRPTSSPPS